MFGFGHGPHGRFGEKGKYIGNSESNPNPSVSITKPSVNRQINPDEGHRRRIEESISGKKQSPSMIRLLQEADSARHFADVTEANKLKRKEEEMSRMETVHKIIPLFPKPQLNIIQEGILSEIDKQISTRKNSTTQWSELAIACLFATSDREMKSIRSKDDFEALVNAAIRANKLYCSSLISYINHLKSETDFQKIKRYIDNFVLPSRFRGNEILKVWLVGQNIPNKVDPYKWNIGVQKRDKRSDFYGVARNPLYEGHISVTFNREEVYPFGFDIKSTDRDYICNIGGGGYSDPEDAELWKKIYRDTISSLLSVEGTSTISRDVANSEFRDKSHPYWNFFEILSSEPSFAQGITRSVFSMNVSYPVFFYDGTKVVDLHKLASEIDLSKSQITRNSDKNARSEAAKYFYSLENYNNRGQMISKHEGECRLKNPSIIKSTTNIDAQSMLQGFEVDTQFIENGRQDSSSASGGGANSVQIFPPVNGKSGGRRMPGGSRRHKRKSRRRKTRRRK